MISLYTRNGSANDSAILATYQDGAVIAYKDGEDSSYRNRTLEIIPPPNEELINGASITQVGYGTTPLTDDEVEKIADKFGTHEDGSSKNIAVADGVNKDFDTTKGLAKITAKTSSIVDGRTQHNFNQMMDIIRKELYLPTSDFNFKSQLNLLATRYNRFKLPNIDMEIRKGFAHVFFCRPNLNLLTNTGDLLEEVKAAGSYEDIFLQNKVNIYELTSMSQPAHNSDFMFTLSNYVKSFSLSDEELHSDTYGKTYTGYKISYGKTNIESKTAGSFSVTYSDDKNLSIYKIHRVWTDYINDVYRGTITPDLNNIANKTLDYVGSVYYILTAEDNETILFWSKYYGVYPTNIPSSQYSWNAGSVVNPENITINYNYSWKEDYTPSAIAEFNFNARLDRYNGTSGIRYAPTYDTRIAGNGSAPKLGVSGRTIVGTPYIETVLANELGNGKSLPYTDRSVYKLRFIPDEKM